MTRQQFIALRLLNNLRRGVMVTPKFLALVFPVRIGAAQQNGFIRLFIFTTTPGAGRCETCKPQTYPRGVMVAAMDSKSIPVQGCRFKSGRGYEIAGVLA